MITRGAFIFISNIYAIFRLKQNYGKTKVINYDPNDSSPDKLIIKSKFTKDFTNLGPDGPN
jgi:hypothetical protein